MDMAAPPNKSFKHKTINITITNDIAAPPNKSFNHLILNKKLLDMIGFNITTQKTTQARRGPARHCWT